MATYDPVERALDAAGILVAVIVHPERGAGATLERVNQAFARALNMPSTIIDGARCSLLCDAISDLGGKAALISALQSGAHSEVEVQIGTTELPKSLSLTLTSHESDHSGEPKLVMIGRDVTSFRLKSSRDDRLQFLLTSLFVRADAPIVLTTPSGEVVMANVAFRTLAGFSGDDLSRMQFRDVVAAKYNRAVAEADGKQLEDNQTYRAEIAIVSKSGAHIPVRMTSVPLSNGEQSFRVVTMLPPAEAGSADGIPVEVRPIIPQRPGDFRPLTLAALQLVLGDLWQKVGLKVMLRAEQIIRKRLHATDVMARLDDHSFGIWFAASDPDENESALATISKHVRLQIIAEFSEEISSRLPADRQVGLDTLASQLVSCPAIADHQHRITLSNESLGART